MEKVCSKCKQLLPQASFSKWKRAKDGLSYYCGPCKRTLDSRYSRARGRALFRAAEKKCRDCKRLLPGDQFHRSKYEPDGLAIYCKGCKSARAKAHYAGNAEKIKARVASHYLAAHDKQLEYRRKYYHRHKLENKEQALERLRKYRQKHRALCASRVKRWHQANPDATIAIKHRRRARERVASGDHTGKQVQELYIQQDGKCVYCEQDLGSRYHADHITPLVRGGSNGIENIQLLCPACNHSKQSKTHEEYAAYRRALSTLEVCNHGCSQPRPIPQATATGPQYRELMRPDPVMVQCKSGEIGGSPNVKTRAIPSQASQEEGVTISGLPQVGPSGPKCPTPRKR